MKQSLPAVLHGRFRHVIYSPQGEIEGIMLEVGQQPVQVVFDRHDSLSSAPFLALKDGVPVSVAARAAPPSPKGKSEHAVHDFVELVDIDGAPPLDATTTASYSGRVQRFNYARHGAINGVVLDSGDFLHLKPEGYARFQLAIGDFVEAEGDAYQLHSASGWAVEATAINGRAVR